MSALPGYTPSPPSSLFASAPSDLLVPPSVLDHPPYHAPACVNRHRQLAHPILQHPMTTRFSRTPGVGFTGTGGVPRPAPTAPYHPHGDTATYRDLLLFEERLKMNAEMLRRRRTRYNGTS